jgi:hypothetical protein
LEQAYRKASDERPGLRRVSLPPNAPQGLSDAIDRAATTPKLQEDILNAVKRAKALHERLAGKRFERKSAEMLAALAFLESQVE